MFNFKPEVVLNNNGELYFVQRSEEGLYIEFAKTVFNTGIFPIAKRPSREES